MRTRHARSVASTVLLVAVTLVALVSAACGGGDDDVAEDEPATTASVDGAGSGETADESVGSDDAGDDTEPLALGLVVEGPAGTEIDFEIIGSYQGEEQPPIAQTTTLGDGPAQVLLTAFIESAAFSVEVLDGGPVTVRGVRGRMEDPENPLGDIDVDQDLFTSELEPGGQIGFELP